MTIEKAIEILGELMRNKKTDKYTNEEIGLALEIAICNMQANLVDNAPTVEERPQGEWIEADNHNIVCPFCGGIRRDCRIDHINFCNRCGAKMKNG